MASSTEDYGSELQELQWGLRDAGGGSSHYLRSGVGGGSSHYLRSGGGGPGGSFEAEDLEMSSSSRLHHHHHQQQQQHHLQGVGGRDRGYYSPPGTSYTIVERPPSAPAHHSSSQQQHHHQQQQHHSSNHATPYRHRGHGATSAASALGGASGPISPEQVISLFGNGLQRRGGNERRTPASSPASVAAMRGGGGGMGSSSAQATSSSTSNLQTSPQSLSLQELTVRTITMTRDPPDSHHGFGICVKGGKDAGIDPPQPGMHFPDKRRSKARVGVYISRVEEGSVAERAGLRPGDTILEVNGTPFRAVTHEEALKMLKSCRTLSMTVRGPAIDPRCRGGHPVWPQNRQQTCSWMDRQGRPASPPPVNLHEARYRHRQRKLDLVIEPGQSLGLMIRGGLEYGLGIYVTGVDKDSVADRAGLLVGDQILEVNGQSFEEATHDEAVQILKTNKRMSLIIRDVGKVPHSCTTSQPMVVPMSRYQDHDTSILESPGNRRSPSPSNSLSDWRHRGVQPISAATAAMVEEKARIVLARSERAALSQLLADYRSRRLNVEDLVVSLGDLLNTHEKLTLLTELRELVDLKDRPIFDDLVYRPRLSRRKGDRVHNSDLIVAPSMHELPRVVTGSCYRPGRGSDIEGDPFAVTGPLLLRENQEYRSPSEDSGLGPEMTRTRGSYRRAHHYQVVASDFALSNDDEFDSQDYVDEDLDCDRGGRRHSSPGGRRNYQHHHLLADNLGEIDGICELSETDLMLGNGMTLRERDIEDVLDEERDERSSESGGGFGGWKNHLLGGITQRVKSWYWGRPLEIGHKLSRSYDMQEAQLLDESGNRIMDGHGGHGSMQRRHHSAQRLRDGELGPGGGPPLRREEDAAVVLPDHQGNLRIIVRKSKPTLGIAIEGGANTKHPLPRIINIHDNGAAYDAGGLEVGQLILEVDGHKVEGLHHQEVARLIAESFARRDRGEIEFLVVEAKKSNLEPKPTALIFLEA
uniref:PDZ domain-containing protein n=1 Tax=Trichogramma kaykai TaxID=54128 RepID=A0ABD2X5M7_9HYME